MLTLQVSVPELKAHAQAIREMAQDPMATLQSLAGDLRPRFESWLNELMKAELGLHLGREPYDGLTWVPWTGDRFRTQDPPGLLNGQV